MPSAKRLSSAIEVASTPNPPKKSKRSRGAVVKVGEVLDRSDAPEGVVSADEVTDLKAQVEELQSFIMDQGLMTSKFSAEPWPVLRLLTFAKRQLHQSNDASNRIQMQRLISINIYA